MKNNIPYRISAALLGLATLFCAFFLNFFDFTLNYIVSQSSFNYSIFSAIKKLTSMSDPSADKDSTTLLEALKPMVEPAITFFVLLIIALVIGIVITIISASSDYHVPQAVMAGIAFILLVVAASFATKALGCLVPTQDADGNTVAAKVTLSSIVAATTGELDTSNVLSTLGSAFATITVATLSYGYYIIMMIFAVIFIWSIIAGALYNSNQPVKTGHGRHKEYRRKKPMRSISATKKATAE